MAIVFLSYQHDDEELARALALRLERTGHTFRIPVGAVVAGDWQETFLNALEKSDAIVILLTENGLRSRYVLGQLGSSRVLRKWKGMLILPVTFGEIPEVAGDIGCHFLKRQDETGLDNLAEQLDKAIRAHTLAPSIFISHRHEDERIAAALVSLLKAAFRIENPDIRCTSVPGHTLPTGVQVSDRLRHDVLGAQLVIGIIGPDTAESRYVLFELGASWACAIPTFPLLVRGASIADVPGPLAERHSPSLEQTHNCVNLIANIAGETVLQRQEGAEATIYQEAERLSVLARAMKTKSAAAQGVREHSVIATSGPRRW
jgi:hypothetical protein